MPKVVKSALAQSSLVEQAVELMTHHSTVEWFTVLAGKDEVEFVRAVPCRPTRASVYHDACAVRRR